MPNSSLLNVLLGLPEIVIFCQILRIDSHLNDFTILLELAEHVNIDVAPIIDVFVVFVLSINLPISKQNSVFKNVLRRDLVVSFLNGSPR